MFDLSSGDGFEPDDTIWADSTPAAPFAQSREPTGDLDDLSRRVVHLARAEARRSRPQSGAGAWVRRLLLGDVEPPRPLANPVLETLRRFCISVRLGEAQSEELAQTLMSKGHYDKAQITTARRMSLAG
ncbi:MAG: hypothetical protein KGJ57_07815 [Sphingomonadales bacterium]|nr:hypothetical protein [Sphingomonadales bacterium]